jgi:hypothetical protein
MNESNFPYGKISNPAQLGTLISQVRKGAGGHPGGPLGPGRGGATTHRRDRAGQADR